MPLIFKINQSKVNQLQNRSF